MTMIRLPMRRSSLWRRFASTAVVPEVLKPMSQPKLYRYLQLETFTQAELEQVYDRINTITVDGSSIGTNGSNNSSGNNNNNNNNERIDSRKLTSFMLQRIHQLEEENDRKSEPETPATLVQKQEYATREAQRILQAIDTTITVHDNDNNGISRTDFCNNIRTQAARVNISWPIFASMLLVGSSVGVTSPAMPFVVENLGLTASQYGLVVSAFPLSKMVGNIPSSIAVERHGRKPYMTYSLLVCAVGVGGVGLATSMEELYMMRLLTGFGVSFLSTAGTLMITDLSTPLNRASTFAPIMSAFAAGMALGPALGGYLVDTVGIQSTFYLVGMSYLGVAGLNSLILEETKAQMMYFPWQSKKRIETKTATVSQSAREAIGQWSPLMKTTAIRNTLLMNGCYNVALSGSQMTLLPLILTASDGFAMSASQLGYAFMGMSFVQIVGTPIFARVMDKIGKPPAIIGGCTLISFSMASLGYCEDMTQLAAVLGIWGAGSSMLSTAPLAYMSDQVSSDKQRPQAIALLRTCGDVGFLLGAFCTGALADVLGSSELAVQSSSAFLIASTAWFARTIYAQSKSIKK